MAESLDMLAHWVGTYTLDARLALEKGDITNSELARGRLIDELKRMGDNPTITGCLEYLRRTEWKTPDEIDLFTKTYDGLVPTSGDVGAVVGNLFKKS